MEKKGCKGSCAQPPCRECKMVDPCAKRYEPPAKCLRYYSCNLDKLCPCDYCEDEFDRGEYTPLHFMVVFVVFKSKACLKTFLLNLYYTKIEMKYKK